MTNYLLSYRSYARSFRRPLITAHGVWSLREGIIIELRPDVRPDVRSSLISRRATDGTDYPEYTDRRKQQDDDPDPTPKNWSDPQLGIGYGEIAPLPWFGSETQTEALEFCRSLSGAIDDAAIDQIPEDLPACQFAFESARAALRTMRSPHTSSLQSRQPLPICQLLPAGPASLTAIDALTQSSTHPTAPPYRHTYKWKIGTIAIDQELEIVQALRDRLPPGSNLRLDANGGLRLRQAHRWLELCDRLNQPSTANPPRIEFIEQPLPPTQWRDLVQLSETFATPIALDESIATLPQLYAAHAQGWRGLYVIKPAIIGSPQKLRSFCRTHSIDTVFSSVFETAIGRDAGLRLAQELQTCDRAVGYGLDDWLMPSEDDP
ncbi:MAG: o-succinylbenzoate synthase [Oscillatoriales cyanobacterium]|nr:MAG: o-succinylbenzoate synthase [Oscillatoriales cyanobacterium]